MNKDFTIFAVSNGQILRSGQIQEEYFDALPEDSSEGVIEGVFDTNDYWIDNEVATLRERLPAYTVTGSVVEFASALPAGTQIFQHMRFYKSTFSLSGSAFALSLPDEGYVEIFPPWPVVPEIIVLTEDSATIPAGAQIFEPELSYLKLYYIEDLPNRQEDLVSSLTGNATILSYRIRDSLFSLRDRFINLENDANDNLAMVKLLQYTSNTQQEVLDEIGIRRNFETWVIATAEAMREEAQARLLYAADYQAIIVILAWAEAERVQAVTDAMAYLLTLNE